MMSCIKPSSNVTLLLCQNTLNGLPFVQPSDASKSAGQPFLKSTENASLACVSAAGDA